MSTQNKDHTPDEYITKPSSALTVDYKLFEELLKHSDASNDEKRQFIEIWWNIIVNFVDLGFGIHPLQQADEQNKNIKDISFSDLLGLKTIQPTQDFAKTTNKGEKI